MIILNYLFFFFLLLYVLGNTLVARTFTSVDGRSFEGELVSVSSDEVEVFRILDSKYIRCSKKLFSHADNDFFNSWPNDPSSWSFGKSVSKIYLNAKTKGHKTKKIKISNGNYKIFGDARVSGFTYPVGYYSNHHWFDAKVDLDLRIEREYDEVRLRSTNLEIDFSSVSGPVLARIYTLFLIKIDGDTFLAELDINDTIIRLANDPIYVESDYLRHYYGYGVFAFNLVTGQLIGISANSYQSEKFLLNLMKEI